MITVESCLPGHPDKIIDQIADAILDECLKQDKNSRVAVEGMGTDGMIFLGGELTTKAYVDVKKIARQVCKECGYNKEVGVINVINRQSPEISKLADKGAGDSGIVYGYACNETPEMIPWAIKEVHDRAKRYFKRYKKDGKVQITYDIEKGEIVNEVAKIQGRDFELGGFDADTGLTGRKTQVDSYCGLVPHGGGAFSGKDATKVDRSGAYMSRWLAKKMLKKFDLSEIIISLAYEIGKTQPVNIEVDAWKIDSEFNENIDEIIIREIKKYDCSPKGIIKRFGLDKPKGWSYKQTACYGHFGRMEFPWEKI